jgi:DNA-directed RNA polymerase specialized sigma24 family protein
VLFDVGADAEHRFEPGLPGALAALSRRQRLAVVLVHGDGYTLREVAELIGIKPTTVQNHLSRGLSRLVARLRMRRARPRTAPRACQGLASSRL